MSAAIAFFCSNMVENLRFTIWVLVM